ncbi:hypothetical protein [Bradyrhizobium sp. CB3481]|uniref:hypothetical protein n=1 Tax=Bradyrhizobium sp. CB3481 TaxID=3039158 RepID=UPI0024B1C72C|nr:hypothetical protein [Bradyrhizobium sp. CB3481]WFU13848.1 hypothetical protein QA643_21670 [Bradyrhizobium sp. CB3481]
MMKSGCGAAGFFCRQSPRQWTSKFSATCLEIEEHFGCNFGGGNGQLDLAAMKSTGPAAEKHLRI